MGMKILPNIRPWTKKKSAVKNFENNICFLKKITNVSEEGQSSEEQGGGGG